MSEPVRLCNMCQKEQPLSRFNFVRGKPHGYCRACKTESGREQRLKDGVKEKLISPMQNGQKLCHTCSIVKPLSGFSPLKSGRGGVAAWCKSCKAEAEHARRRAQGICRKELSFIKGDQKFCMICKDIKPISSFSPSVRGLGGISAYCKPCHATRYPRTKDGNRQATAAYRRRHPERWAALHRLTQFRRRTSQRVTADGTVNDVFLKSLYATEQCAYCGQTTPREQRTADHMTPLARGGSHSASNLIMACNACNSAKGARTFEEFMEAIK